MPCAPWHASLLSVGSQGGDAVSLGLRNVSLLRFSSLLWWIGIATSRSFQKLSTHSSFPQRCKGGRREGAGEDEEVT